MAAVHIYSRGMGAHYLRDQLREMLEHRDLLLLLTQKELKVKYKGTALGFFWSLLNPLLMMVVYTAVFTVIARFPIERYPVFVLAGLFPWTAFASAVNGATNTVVLNHSLVRRVRFPVEFLPLSIVLGYLVNLLPSLAILFLFAIGFHQSLGWPLLALPVLVLFQGMFTIGISLIVSSLTVFFRDVEHLVTLALTVWFFGTPVLYPLSTFDHHRKLQTLLQLNPMTWLMDSYQRIWHANTWPNPVFVAAFGAIGVVMMMGGQYIFSRLSRRFAEEV